VPRSQELEMLSYLESGEVHTLTSRLFKAHLKVIFHSTLRLPSRSFVSGFRLKFCIPFSSLVSGGSQDCNCTEMLIQKCRHTSLPVWRSSYLLKSRLSRSNCLHTVTWLLGKGTGWLVCYRRKWVTHVGTAVTRQMWKCNASLVSDYANVHILRGGPENARL
jgi:hypothetical protein